MRRKQGIFQVLAITLAVSSWPALADHGALLQSYTSPYQRPVAAQAHASDLHRKFWGYNGYGTGFPCTTCAGGSTGFGYPSTYSPYSSPYSSAYPGYGYSGYPSLGYGYPGYGSSYPGYGSSYPGYGYGSYPGYGYGSYPGYGSSYGGYPSSYGGYPGYGGYGGYPSYSSGYGGYPGYGGASGYNFNFSLGGFAL